MKTKIISMLGLLLISIAASAQSNSNGCLGIYVGPNFSSFNIHSPELSATSATGYQFGGFYRKGGFFYGQAGLQYSQLKSNLVVTDSFGPVSGGVDLHRIEMPLYGGINLLNFSKKVINVRAYAGPVISYTTKSPSFNTDISSGDFSKFGLNATIGAGVDVLIFSLDAGYTMGINNLFAGNYDGNGNYAFVNVGLKF